jgi:hypothetical protein
MSCKAMPSGAIGILIIGGMIVFSPFYYIYKGLKYTKEKFTSNDVNRERNEEEQNHSSLSIQTEPLNHTKQEI